MKRIMFLLAVMLVCFANLQGAIYEYYNFSQAITTYTPFTGIAVTSILGDDMLSEAIPIGFTFPYGTEAYTEVKIDSNGHICLGIAQQWSNLTNNLSAAATVSNLAPLWDDTSLEGGTCQYLTDGTAPNRIFRIQYENLRWYYWEENLFNFQIWMHENGKIEFIYGSSTGIPTSASASIGINMIPGGVNNFYSVTPGTPATASFTTENGSITTFPGNGEKYIFDIIPPVPNDMAAMTITGNTTPSEGTPSVYGVSVRNAGTAAQSNYEVRIMSGTNVLATTAGPAIAPGIIQNVQVSWTPQTTGPMAIYGNVLLAGDENPQNNSTSPINVNVMGAGTLAVTVGSGDELANIPVNMFWRNSLFETIYLASEMNIAGLITGLAFYNNFETNLPGKPTKIWLGTTGQSDLSTGWILSTQLTLVYDGNIDYPSGQNTILIPFSTPFIYAGGNLVLMANRPMDTTYFSSLDQFASQTVGENRSLDVYSDMEEYIPASPPANATLSGLFPKTTFYLTSSGPNPTFAVSPSSMNYGTVLMNNQVSQLFSIVNTGGGTLTISSITLDGSPYFTLSNVPPLPVTLGSMQPIQFTNIYFPLAAGTHTGTITITDNLTRTVHTIPLTATCIDPNIYTSPYLQNFDNVAIPSMPADWSRLITPNGTGATVMTTASEAHSTPNSAALYNAWNNTTDIFLIAPPLAPVLNLNNMRVKFWARGMTNSSVDVGIISDITDPASYISVSNVTLTSVWAEYVINLAPYAGTGRRVAIKHGNTNWGDNILIDDVTIETNPQNDLAAISVTGNVTPSVGMVTNYSISVYNWGTNAQTNYTVKLFKEGDIEVASTAGTQINPGSTASFTLSWTPDTAGNSYIYGKVVLTGDENTLNDQTLNLSVVVQPAGTMVVTIGDGSETGMMPVNMFYMNSLFETIYLSTELNFLGMITGVSFYNNFITDLPSMPTNIWLGTTTEQNLEAAWIPSTQLTSVFSGNVNYPAGENLITISFPAPFLYLQDNLVMMVERPMDAQYYNWSDVFYTQTIGTNRSRDVWDDMTDFDPASPPDFATISGMFPKTSFLAIPGGVGHLTGTVYGVGNQPLSNATVQIVGGYQTTTNAQGSYLIQNLIADDYQVSCSHFGYISQTVNVTIPEDSTVTQNFNLQQMPMVNVTGTIVGSDAPTVGLAGATITLTGYENYQGTTNAQGVFTILNVYANQAYQYSASALGYQVLTGTINVGAANHDMGTVTLSEIAYTPRSVTATVVANPAAVNVTWLAPDPSTVDVDQSFEGTTFPPTDWSRIVTNNGPANTVGVFPTWCRVGTITSGTTTITPSDGAWQTGFWWDYNHQDEWLISPAFNCPQGATLIFDTYCFYGSINDDHYYVKISNNNGTTWNVLWDASTLTGGWNAYQVPVEIELSAYIGQQVKVAWHADDPNASSDGMWYNWFIDNVEVSNQTSTIRFPAESLTLRTAGKDRNAPQPVFTTAPISKATDAISLGSDNISVPVPQTRPGRDRHRSLQGYKVWRLLNGQEQNEQTWVLLTPTLITDLNYSDTETPSLPAGTYKWAVKAIYTNNVLSLSAFSNPITLGNIIVGTLTGVIRTGNNTPIQGAVIQAGTSTATSNSSGVYSMQVATGTYAVTCSATGYQTVTHENVVIMENQTTIHNFIMTVGINEEVLITRTALKGNYPNPFNPETTITFDTKGVQPVRIEIYNLKGQLIRTLVNEVKGNGHHTVVWNGRDEYGKAVASGIYQYRMQSGEYTANRRMLLLK
jgi:hypothetical protein